MTDYVEVEVLTIEPAKSTPANIIRVHAAELFYQRLNIAAAIVDGGLELSEKGIEAALEAGIDVTDRLLMATISERLKALELLGKVGIGFRTDHTTGDEAVEPGVVVFGPWDAESGRVQPGSTKALPGPQIDSQPNPVENGESTE